MLLGVFISTPEGTSRGAAAQISSIGAAVAAGAVPSDGSGWVSYVEPAWLLAPTIRSNDWLIMAFRVGEKLVLMGDYWFIHG